MQVTTAKGLLATPKWSPDGRSVAVLHTEDATREAGPLVRETPETGVIKDVFFEQRRPGRRCVAGRDTG
jgi:hypothetical protein